MNHDPAYGNSESPGFWRSRYAIGLLVFGAAALYFLLTEHRAHFFAALPLLILLACPLMHVFMHHGHGHGHGHEHGHSDVAAPGRDEPSDTPARALPPVTRERGL